MKIKWYEYRNLRTKELIWWTQRDRNGNCFEIRQDPLSRRLRLFANDCYKSHYDTLAEAQKAAADEWVE